MRIYNKKIYIFIELVLLIGIVYVLVSYFPNAEDIKKCNTGKNILEIKTYLAGDNQPTHPSVICFDEKWNGYRYWMVYTPYPYENGEEENPCVVGSNDMVNWENPKGIVNPIATNEETGCSELKDGHLVYNAQKNLLEVWYLGRLSEDFGGDGDTLIMFRKISSDGINWSEYEIVNNNFPCISQSVIWKDNQYLCWGIGYWNDTKGKFLLYKSCDGINWENPVECEIGQEKHNLDIWHGATYYNADKNIYEFVWINNENRKKEIYYATSEDGVKFDDGCEVIRLGKEYDSFYRPCLTYINDQYYCFYGVINYVHDNKRVYRLSMSKGKDIHSLEGFSNGGISSVEDLKKYKKIINISHIGEWFLYIRDFFSIELFAFVVFGVLYSYFKEKMNLHGWNAFVILLEIFVLYKLSKGIVIDVFYDYIILLCVCSFTAFICLISGDYICRWIKREKYEE